MAVDLQYRPPMSGGSINTLRHTSTVVIINALFTSSTQKLLEMINRTKNANSCFFSGDFTNFLGLNLNFFGNRRKCQNSETFTLQGLVLDASIQHWKSCFILGYVSPLHDFQLGYCHSYLCQFLGISQFFGDMMKMLKRNTFLKA